MSTFRSIDGSQVPKKLALADYGKDPSLPLATDIVDLSIVKDLVKDAEQGIEQGVVTAQELEKAFSLMDLTTLNPTDTIQSVGVMVERVLNLQQSVPEMRPLGGVCVPGETAEVAARLLKGNDTRTATVVNFALGQSPLSAVLDETQSRLEQGVDEIDLVFPLGNFLSGQDHLQLISFVAQVKDLCEQYGAPLKTIIQSDELEVGKEKFDERVLKDIETLASIAYAGGSDMVKTSTGKGAGKGASLQSAAVIALVAKHYRDNTNYVETFGHDPGIKISGGVKDGVTAAAYLALISEVLGPQALTPDLFRFGASSLAGSLLGALTDTDSHLGRALNTAGVKSDYFSNVEGSSY